MSHNTSNVIKSYMQSISNKNLNQKNEHSLFGILSGQIKDKQKLKNYNINDPNSQILLSSASFNKADSTLSFQQKCLQLFYDKKYSPQQFQIAIKQYTKNIQNGEIDLQYYKNRAKQMKPKFCKKYNVSQSQGYGCCLALSYYTGAHISVNSQRISRQSNLIMKANILQVQWKIKDTPQHKNMKCIVYWLIQALHYIPLHWGQVSRLVQLKDQQKSIYKTGNIVTWIQFSSSSYKQPTSNFMKRNTYFKIYSLSGRCIQQFSNYDNQSQVLFKPYSHFLVFKTQNKNNKFYVHLRQIFFGQSKYNILWVDDNIFNKQWQNKKLMQQSILKNPLLSFVPKISTQSAMAFIKSQFCRYRKNHQFRIISDMNRTNQKASHDAGARFAKQLFDLFQHLQLMIYTSNQKSALKQLTELKVNLKKIKVTTKPSQAKLYLDFK